MDRLNEWLGNCRSVSGEHLLLSADDTVSYVAIDPMKLEVEVAAGIAGKLTLLHRTEQTERATLHITLHEGAQLMLTEILCTPINTDLTLIQERGSDCRTTLVLLAGADWQCRTELTAPQAENNLHGLFLLGDDERGSITLRTDHLVSDGRSNSVIKGVVGGSATGRFAGLVYVAPDAQRTDARQQNRNIVLSPSARIDALPQLEIYADDVQCSHGASIGQPDDEAIYYMRQRGLSEAAARRLQIEGFAADIIRHCADEELAGIVSDAVAEKLEKL